MEVDRLYAIVRDALIVAGVEPREAEYRAWWPSHGYTQMAQQGLTWLLAEEYWRADTGIEDRDLINQSMIVRTRCLRKAMITMSQMRATSEGLTPPMRLEKARAHYLAHFVQVAELRNEQRRERAATGEAAGDSHSCGSSEENGSPVQSLRDASDTVE